MRFQSLLQSPFPFPSFRCVFSSLRGPRHKLALLLLLLLRECILSESPENAEEEALEAVRNNLCRESTEEEAVQTVLLNNHSECLDVRDGRRARLCRRLEHTNAVARCIGHGTRTEANHGSTREIFGQLCASIIFGQVRIEVIIREEPVVELRRVQKEICRNMH